jgi:hypothetical protein
MKTLSINAKDGMNARAHRKENSFMYNYIGLAVVDDKIVEAVDCRIYGTNARNYCCLWWRANGKYGSGSDYAGGYGYHRPSAAAAGAFSASGVELDSDISGRGDRAIEDAVLALTQSLYPNAHCQVIVAHG